MDFLFGSWPCSYSSRRGISQRSNCIDREGGSRGFSAASLPEAPPVNGDATRTIEKTQENCGLFQCAQACNASRAASSVGGKFPCQPSPDGLHLAGMNQRRETSGSRLMESGSMPMTLLDRCRAETARLQEELRRRIRFIEAGIRINTHAGAIEHLRAKLSELNALEERYATR